MRARSTIEFKTGATEANKASTMGRRFLDLRRSRTARSTRTARICFTAGRFKPVADTSEMQTMRKSKIRHESRQKSQPACAMYVMMSSTVKRPVKIRSTGDM